MRGVSPRREPSSAGKTLMEVFFPTTTKVNIATVLMHYSVPGLPPHEGRCPSYADAEQKAHALAVRTGAPAAVLAHYAVPVGSLDSTRKEERVELSAVVTPSGLFLLVGVP